MMSLFVAHRDWAGPEGKGASERMLTVRSALASLIGREQALETGAAKECAACSAGLAWEGRASMHCGGLVLTGKGLHSSSKGAAVTCRPHCACYCGAHAVELPWGPVGLMLDCKCCPSLSAAVSQPNILWQPFGLFSWWNRRPSPLLPCPCLAPGRVDARVLLGQPLLHAVLPLLWVQGVNGEERELNRTSSFV